MKLASFVLVLASAPVCAQEVVFSDDFEAGLGNWTAASIWHLEDASDICGLEVAPLPSGSKAAYFGVAGVCDYQNTSGGVAWFDGALTLNTPIALPATANSIAFTFHTNSEAEDDGIWDLRRPEVSVDGTNWTQLPFVYSSGWMIQRYDLSAWRGQSIQVRFDFWSGDDVWNQGRGWFIDNVTITASTSPATPFCLGDGTWTPCPCGNTGAPGHGCASSFNSAGALLTANGIASVSADSLSFQASGVGGNSTTFYQGSQMQTLHAQMFGGDGLGCVKSALVRIRTVQPSGGSATYPSVGAPSISVRGLLPAAGGQRYYQARYRNTANFCWAPQYFNQSNGLIVTWAP